VGCAPAAGELRRRPSVPVGLLVAKELTTILLGDPLDHVRGNAQAAHHVVVDHDQPAAGARAHREILASGHPQLRTTKTSSGAPRASAIS
jgi:hypothetical protein